ncbi:MAG: hypothetical protein JPMHGGIA_01683 [Saprospiraceae bacterium]|nr:hypothetical protein [Saprospiraceae bacterium]
MLLIHFLPRDQHSKTAKPFAEKDRNATTDRLTSDTNGVKKFIALWLDIIRFSPH